MDTSAALRLELLDLLLRLSASLKEEDLEDPTSFALASQLVQILEPKPNPLPQADVDHLSSIQNKADQFRTAVLMYGAQDDSSKGALVESMKAAGLLKSTRPENPIIPSQRPSIFQRARSVVESLRKPKSYGVLTKDSFPSTGHTVRQEDIADSNRARAIPSTGSAAQ